VRNIAETGRACCSRQHEPFAASENRVATWGLGMTLQAKGTTLDTVALRFYINKGVHPIVGIPWGAQCAARFPDVRKCEINFLLKADMAKLSAAF
jgi:hypothetical protein